MAQKKTAILHGSIVLVILLLAAGYYFSSYKGGSDLPPVPSSAEQIEDSPEVATTDGEVAESRFDLSAALNERILGNPDAPVKISEHSSFSCGHCAKFHASTYPDFKANWIDTGKAYVVFSDFPLNAPALYASMAARCVPEDRYFDFVEKLFATQSDWAGQADYFEPLKKMAGEFGLNSDDFKTCVGNEALQEGILDRVRAAQSQFGVNSTPSFVVNNAITISGGAGYEQFNATLEKAISDSANPSVPQSSSDAE